MNRNVDRFVYKEKNLISVQNKKRLQKGKKEKQLCNASERKMLGNAMWMYSEEE